MSNDTVCQLISQRQVALNYFRMTLENPVIARTALPGQFVHVLARGSALSDPLLRRAFSVMAVREQSIDILYRIEGKGTLLMSQWQPGHPVDLLGPLGTPFVIDCQHAVLVGGGVGIPPMVMIASRRHRPQQSSTPPSLHTTRALLGARSQDELICLDDFALYNVVVETATDDGSAGHRGYVTDLLRSCLEQAEAAQSGLPTVFACGPLPMLQAVASLCARFAAPCQVSLEENMPCGVGVCNGCVVPVRGEGDDYSRYRRICVEGPVLWADEVDWSHYTLTCPISN